MAYSIILAEQGLKSLFNSILTSIVTLIFLIFLEATPYDLYLDNNRGNLINFLSHLLGLLLWQGLSYFFILQDHQGSNKVWLSNFIGIPMGLLSFYIFFVLTDFNF